MVEYRHLQDNVDLLNFLSALTPFHYYNSPNVMYEGLRLSNVTVLLAVTIVPLAAALPIFRRRDLRTH